jgi:excisionase family DNA binding protein
MAEIKRLYTIREVAEKAQVTEVTVYRHVDKGALRVTRVGRCIRVPEDSLLEYLGLTDDHVDHRER